MIELIRERGKQLLKKAEECGELAVKYVRDLKGQKVELFAEIEGESDQKIGGTNEAPHDGSGVLCAQK